LAQGKPPRAQSNLQEAKGTVNIKEILTIPSPALRDEAALKSAATRKAIGAPRQ
jgi:hypothetical protein